MRAARGHLAARRRGCRDAQGARGSWDRPGRLHPPAQRAGSGPLGDQLSQLDQDLVRAAALPAATLPARPPAAIRRPRHVLPPCGFSGRWRLRPHAAGAGGGGFVHPLPPARPNPPYQSRGDHLRSPGRRLGRAPSELDLLQGRSTLGARVSQRTRAALPRARSKVSGGTKRGACRCG
jgi:hypothetical protein